MEPTRKSASLIGILLLSPLATLPSTVFAARVVTMSVELDGQRILEYSTIDNGFPDAYTVWRYLKERPLHVAPGFVVQPAPESPSQAVLRGDIVVKVTYGAEVRTDSLRLLAASGGWLIESAWVEENGPAFDPARRHHRPAWETYLHQAVMVLGGVGILIGLVCRIATDWAGPQRWVPWAAAAAFACVGASVVLGVLFIHW